MLNEDRIAWLIFQNGLDKLSNEDKIELAAWASESDRNKQLFQQLTDPEYLTSYFAFKAKMEAVLDKELARSKISIFLRDWRKYAAVAAIFILAVSGFFIWRDKNENKIVAAAVKPSQNDVLPGSNRAVLKLANGTQIILDSTGKGLITQQGNTTIYNNQGVLVYRDKGTPLQAVFYNSLETGVGETYTITLPDGTKVWLNSKSSIRYPVAFSARERVVELHGEGYFEVAKDKAKVFKVNVDGKGEIEVLGTHFNVNAYPDEPTIQTTLLEGSVTFTKNIPADLASKVKIVPGQQVNLNLEGDIEILSNVNVDAVSAWKDQTFYFASYNLKTIMRQLSRWYGTDVIYEGNISDLTFSGIVNRNRNLSDVLKALELNGVHFRMEGKKLFVSQ
ncbi:MAG: FecR domain-containing protein [Chitinophagaceae bacterium]